MVHGSIIISHLYLALIFIYGKITCKNSTENEIVSQAKPFNTPLVGLPDYFITGSSLRD